MSKRYKKLPNDSKEMNAVTIDKLLTTIKTNCTTKFDESVDLNFRINNKQKKMKLTLGRLLICQVVQEKL